MLDIRISPDKALRPKSLLFFKVGPNEKESSLPTLTVEECFGFFDCSKLNTSSGVPVELLF
jgi:hypothetical protein